MNAGHARTVLIVICFCALAAAPLAGCSNPAAPAGGTTSSGSMMGATVPSSGTDGYGASGGMMGQGGTGSTSYSSDGQRIYLTGVGSDGQTIPHTAPRVSQGALMMGGGGCGSCHGANGRGGTIRMMIGAAIKAPDITHAALVKAGFTDATIADAIRKGTDESGKPLKDAMPRWKMSDADLNATIAYLKVLGTQ